MSRILILSYLPVIPANSGGRVRIYQIAARLSRIHNVTMLCPPFAQRCREPLPFALRHLPAGGKRQLFDPRTYQSIFQSIRRQRPDVVLVEYVWQGLHAKAGLLGVTGRLIVDAFDVVTVRLRRSKHPLWAVVSLYERQVLRAANQVFAASETDRRRLVALGASVERTSLVPNGVDTAVFRPDPAAGRRVRDMLGLRNGERLLFFFGNLDYAPNAEAVTILATEIMPRLERRFRLAIAGPGNTTPLRRYESERLSFLGPVDRIPDYINAADALVAPLVSGSGTRIKLLETIACGVPAITTTVGAEGLDLTACGPALLIADNWDDFATAVRERADGQRMLPPPRFVETYDWQCIVERMPL